MKISGNPPCLRASVVKTTRRGFSLIEMLVVLAVTAILLFLVISPVVTTFNFTNRARRNVEVQDAARYASEVMTREIADAMGVAVAAGDTLPFLYYPKGSPGTGDPVVVRSTGYITGWDDQGKSWHLSHAMIDLVLPHDALGLEGGTIQQPLAIQHTTGSDGVEHPVVVRYFVGLTNPTHFVNGIPAWRNRVVTGVTGPQNLYTLYRVEFDPYDPRYTNWVRPTSPAEKTPDGREVYEINPDFFYDTQTVSFGGESLPRAEWWRRKSVAIMPVASMDLVDFIGPQSNGKPSGAYTNARSLVTFDPLIMPSDAAVPADNGSRPTTYKTQYGQWTGLQNDGTVPADGFSGGIAGYLPHITVLEQERDKDGNIILDPEFDSNTTSGQAAPSARNRVLSWNSQTGEVNFSMPAPDYVNTKGGDSAPSVFEPLANTSGFTAPPNAYITSGSEVVTVWEENPADPGNFRPVVYSRSASATKDVYEVPDEIALQNGMPQQLPPPRQYIVTDTGKIIIGYPYPSVINPVQSQPVPKDHKVQISFRYQNNDPNDLVKVDYQTRELISINLTARMYDPVNRRPITTTVADRVRIRNMQR